MRAPAESDLFCWIGQVHAYVARRIGPVASVEDITSEVFSAALTSRRPTGEELPWLYGIARRKIADAYRRRGIRKETSLAHAEEMHARSTFELLAQDQRAVRIRSLVNDLEMDQREVILLFYVEDLSARQIAQSMGRSESSVTSLLQRARQKLRDKGREFFQEATV